LIQGKTSCGGYFELSLSKNQERKHYIVAQTKTTSVQDSNTIVLVFRN